MADHPNVAKLRNGYEGFVSRDLDAVSRTIAEDAVWHVGGSSELAGDYKGRDAILGLFDTLADYAYTIDVRDVLANDQHGVVLVRAHASRDGDRLDWTSCHVYRLEDGAITEGWFYTDNDTTFDAFFSR
jgi:ketosteroid isomerase-like protein